MLYSIDQVYRLRFVGNHTDQSLPHSARDFAHDIGVQAITRF